MTFWWTSGTKGLIAFQCFTCRRGTSFCTRKYDSILVQKKASAIFTTDCWKLDLRKIFKKYVTHLLICFCQITQRSKSTFSKHRILTLWHKIKTQYDLIFYRSTAEGYSKKIGKPSGIFWQCRITLKALIAFNLQIFSGSLQNIFRSYFSEHLSCFFLIIYSLEMCFN